MARVVDKWPAEKCQEAMQSCAELIADAKNEQQRTFYMVLGQWWAKKKREAEAAK